MCWWSFGAFAGMVNICIYPLEKKIVLKFYYLLVKLNFSPWIWKQRLNYTYFWQLRRIRLGWVIQFMSVKFCHKCLKVIEANKTMPTRH